MFLLITTLINTIHSYFYLLLKISVKSENSSDEEEFQTTLAPSYTVKPNDNSIEGILQQFFSVDILDGANKFLCEHCAGTKSDGRQKGGIV